MIEHGICGMWRIVLHSITLNIGIVGFVSDPNSTIAMEPVDPAANRTDYLGDAGSFCAPETRQ